MDNQFVAFGAFDERNAVNDLQTFSRSICCSLFELWRKVATMTRRPGSMIPMLPYTTSTVSSSTFAVTVGSLCIYGFTNDRTQRAK